MGVIGPHEGKELEFMLNGKKNIALFYSDYNIPDEFLPFLDKKIFELKEVNLANEFVYYIIYKAEYINDINILISLLKNSFGGFYPDLERKIGQLLGYDNDDIEFSIKHCLDLKR